MNPDASIASVLNPGGIPTAWLVLGFFGQVMFSFRFLLQWIASERRRSGVDDGVDPVGWQRTSGVPGAVG